MHSVVEVAKYFSVVGAVGFEGVKERAALTALKVSEKVGVEMPGMGKVLAFARERREEHMHVARFQALPRDTKIRWAINIRKRQYASWSAAEKRLWSVCPTDIQDIAGRDYAVELCFHSLHTWTPLQRTIWNEIPKAVRNSAEDQFPPVGT